MKGTTFLRVLVVIFEDCPSLICFILFRVAYEFMFTFKEPGID